MQIFSRSLEDIDFWGGLFAFFFYLLIYSMWMMRLREKRLRLHAILPVTRLDIGISRMIFVFIIIAASFIYISMQLYLAPSWAEESYSIMAQLGFVYIVFSIFIIGRDLWYLHAGSRLKTAASIILTESIIISCTAMIFIYLRPLLYEISGAFAGRAVFIVWALILMMLTPFTFIKRNRYLA